MIRTAWMSIGTVIGLLLCGCGGPEAPDSGSASNASMQTGLAVQGDSPAGSPTTAVAAFYEALRQGDDTSIAALLTDKAREETAKSGLDIRSQASTTLRYEIGEVDYVTEAMDGAHVKSLWFDTDADGQPTSTEVIWVLRKQADGWRVAGMATPIAEGQLPLLFNFENPDDMLQKKEYIEANQAQLDQPSVHQATAPDSPEASATEMR